MPLTKYISVISWRSVLLAEETGVPRENHRPAASHWQIITLKLYRVDLTWVGFELTTLGVIGTDCIGSYKSNYHTIMTMMAPGEYLLLVVKTDHIYMCRSFMIDLWLIRSIYIGYCSRYISMVYIHFFVHLQCILGTVVVEILLKVALNTITLITWCIL